MKLVRDLKQLKTKHVIISGDGRKEFKIIEEICEKYNGDTKVIWFPKLSAPRKTGLSALDSVKLFPSKFHLNSIIFIVDGEFIGGRADTQIQEYLKKIGIMVVDIQPIQKAFVINCKVGHHEVVLYCIISGPETFIEEEMARLIELELDITIDLAGERDRSWKDRVKREIEHILHENHTSTKQLIRNASSISLEKAFPNLCVVLRNIDENY